MKNKTLFARIKKLGATERRIGVEILECLYEIEIRKAYAELRYDGLYSYCVKELGFTESQAYQRIQAMHAVKELPELKPLIESGSLSVSSVSKVQTHLRREKKKGLSASSIVAFEEPEKTKMSESFLKSDKLDRPEKLKLFQSMENRTSREVDQKLAEVRGEKLREKLVLELDEEGAELWREVMNLSAHKNQAEKEATFKMLMREWLKRNHPAREVRTEKSQKSQKFETELKTEILTQTVTAAATETSPPSQRSVSLLTWQKSQSRSIPLPLRREIWRRDDGKCTNCESSHALEIDHIKPFALGGETKKENLRLLCRSCNQYAAIQVFGRSKILTNAGDHFPRNTSARHSPSARCSGARPLKSG